MTGLGLMGEPSVFAPAMSAQRIRPSLADLASEYDQPAFPELETGTAPAARVSRTRPPTVAEAAATLPRKSSSQRSFGVVRGSN